MVLDSSGTRDRERRVAVGRALGECARRKPAEPTVGSSAGDLFLRRCRGRLLRTLPDYS